MLARLAHAVVRRRKTVIGVWLVLTLFGALSAQRVSDRWSESFSIPGYSAYETNQKALRIFGNGAQPPLVAVFRSNGDVTKEPAIEQAIAKAAARVPGSRASSYYSTGDSVYVSSDRHTTYAEIYPGREPKFALPAYVGKARTAMHDATPAGVQSWLTGRDPLQAASGESGGPSILTEALIGGVGALIILRFREELASGEDTETAIVETMRHAGRSVIVSGSTVAVGLLSMILLPLPFIRSIGIGGMLIPAVSVLVAITLLPALLAVLGPRINRLSVMPQRVTHVGDAESGFWKRWAEVVVRRPIAVAAVGTAIVALLVAVGVQMNPAEAQVKDMPGKGDAVSGRDALASAGISLGALKPFVVLTRPDEARSVAARLRSVEGVAGAAAPPGWRTDGYALVEAIPSTDAASKAARTTIDRVKDALPSGSTLGGVAPEDRDFVHAVYGNFPYVLGFVVLLTYILLARAFRSLVLPLKAVILNLLSLGAAYGIIVFIFQWGHGSEAIWNVHATNAIISWIPLMIFAFLFGLSMDYEVFMLTRMREAYDETGSTRQAVVLGLARTGKLVTSAALVLCLAFFVLSTSPGLDVKQFGIGLAAGIIFDAPVIRALLVPAIMRLLGRWNWWLPHWAARPLRTRPSVAAPESA